MDKLYIIMPAYNEQDNIVNVIDQWYPVVEKIGNDSKLVIIDDGSKDNTYKIMSKLKGKKQLLIPLSIDKYKSASIPFSLAYAFKFFTLFFAPIYISSLTGCSPTFDSTGIP